MNADDPLDAVLNAWTVEEPGDITERLMARIEREALLTEMRSLRADMRGMLHEMGALRSEVAALRRERSAAVPVGQGAARRGQRLLPFAPSTDTPLLLG
jgi:hypothetical protein